MVCAAPQRPSSPAIRLEVKEDTQSEFRGPLHSPRRYGCIHARRTTEFEMT
jgi:hypothetical protein